MWLQLIEPQSLALVCVPSRPMASSMNTPPEQTWFKTWSDRLRGGCRHRARLELERAAYPVPPKVTEQWTPVQPDAKPWQTWEGGHSLMVLFEQLSSLEARSFIYCGPVGRRRGYVGPVGRRRGYVYCTTTPGHIYCAPKCRRSRREYYFLEHDDNDGSWPMCNEYADEFGRLLERRVGTKVVSCSYGFL